LAAKTSSELNTAACRVNVRSILLCLLYSAVIGIAFAVACALRPPPIDTHQSALGNLAWLLPLKLLVLWALGQFRAKLTFLDWRDAAKLALVALASSLAAWASSRGTPFGYYLPFDTVVFDGILFLAGLFGVRIAFAAYRIRRERIRLRPRELKQIHSREHLVDWIQKLEARGILEIGPFDCPLVRGPTVKYFDVMDQARLLERAISIGRTSHLEEIPVIHYVDRDGDLRRVTERFSVCISSHVIEHQPDIVKHLQNVSAMLDNEGLYCLLIPDKRYCFDHFLADSTIADVLDAHLAGRKRHSARAVIEHRAMTCHNDAAKHWRGNHGAFNPSVDSIRAAVEEYVQAHETNEYVDVHAWQLTPSSFREILRLLFDLNYVDFQVEHVGETPKGQLEFCAVLRKQGFCVANPSRV